MLKTSFDFRLENSKKMIILSYSKLLKRISFMLRRRRTGIAFGGGAVRGFAHIGVIKVLQESGIHFDYVVGNSAGSIIGALYAKGMSWQEMVEIAGSIKPVDLLGINFKRRGLFNSDKLELFLGTIFGELTFEDLPTPFRCVAVNLFDGQLVELSSGPIAKAVRASCSVPGFFSPTPYDDQLLVDGGILNSVPADILKKMGADYRVAINLNADRGKFISPKSGMDVLWSAMKIAWNANAFKSLQNVDMVIAPELSSFNHYEIKKLTYLLEAGEQAARAVVDRIARDSRKWKWLF
ncbi:MAG: hypothetical protein EHM72_14920 [Calditrichaeota bacterium]|nr:MAG: hypothetical protein EHM72_14920 [Calditrichota bacterium]